MNLSRAVSTYLSKSARACPQSLRSNGKHPDLRIHLSSLTREQSNLVSGIGKFLRHQV
jgi:hypothetical protein